MGNEDRKIVLCQSSACLEKSCFLYINSTTDFCHWSEIRGSIYTNRQTDRQTDRTFYFLPKTVIKICHYFSSVSFSRQWQYETRKKTLEWQTWEMACLLFLFNDKHPLPTGMTMKKCTEHFRVVLGGHPSLGSRSYTWWWVIRQILRSLEHI